MLSICQIGAFLLLEATQTFFPLREREEALVAAQKHPLAEPRAIQWNMLDLVMEKNQHLHAWEFSLCTDTAEKFLASSRYFPMSVFHKIVAVTFTYSSKCFGGADPVFGAHAGLGGAGAWALLGTVGASLFCSF